MQAAANHNQDILRPFMWIGALSFATGFLGFLALSAHSLPFN